MMQLINDTLKVNGRFSQKRVLTFSAFWVAVVYAFIPLAFPNFPVNDIVFTGFIGFGGWSVLRTQKKNENTIE